MGLAVVLVPRLVSVGGVAEEFQRLEVRTRTWIGQVRRRLVTA